MEGHFFSWESHNALNLMVQATNATFKSICCFQNSLHSEAALPPDRHLSTSHKTKRWPPGWKEVEQQKKRVVKKEKKRAERSKRQHRSHGRVQSPAKCTKEHNVHRRSRPGFIPPRWTNESYWLPTERKWDWRQNGENAGRCYTVEMCVLEGDMR